MTHESLTSIIKTELGATEAARASRSRRPCISTLSKLPKLRRTTTDSRLARHMMRRELQEMAGRRVKGKKGREPLPRRETINGTATHEVDRQGRSGDVADKCNATGVLVVLSLCYTESKLNGDLQWSTA